MHTEPMNDRHPLHRHFTEAGVQEDFQRQPHLFVRLAENALTVAESLRGNYFQNTAKFIAALRKAVAEVQDGRLKTDNIIVPESAQMNAVSTVAHLSATLARYPVPILALWRRCSIGCVI